MFILSVPNACDNVVLIKVCAEVVICSEMTQTVTKHLLGRIDTASDDKHKITHAISPRGKPTTAVNNNVFEGLEFSFNTFVGAKSDLIIDVVL